MSKLSAFSLIQQIHQQAVALAKDFVKLEVQLLSVLEKVDAHKVYRSFGYPSLFQYVTKELNLTDDVAYILINVSRKTSELPALKQAIENNEIPISKAKRLTSVITKDNDQHWLKLAKELSKRELEREVAAAKPTAAIPERAQYVPPDQGLGEWAQIRSFESRHHLGGTKPLKSVRIQLQLGLSEGLMIRLRKVQDLLSSKIRTSATLENTLEALVDHYIQRNCPLERAKRLSIRGKLPLPVGERSLVKAGIKLKRRPLTAHRKHQVRIRDGGKCTFENKSGERCLNKRHLEIHHILHVSKGGTNEIKNLTLLCSGHHKILHLENSNATIESKAYES